MEQGLQELAAYGPVAMLAGMLLLIIRDLVVNRRQESDPKVGEVLSRLADRLDADKELARAIDRLSMVLERMESDHGKALEQIQKQLQAQRQVLDRIDYRTDDILERIAQGGN